MTKKEYLQPAMTVHAVDLDEQILVGSTVTINTTGLDEKIDIDDTSDNPWEVAW